MVTRRSFLYLTAAACVGRAARAENALHGALPTVRAPAVGQSWRYAKYDYFTGKRLDTQTDRVSKVGTSVEIESVSESDAGSLITYPSWGVDWWHEYMPDESREGGLIEVQKPWGSVVVDPHWSELQTFEKAIPIWPSQLRPGWSAVVSTHYQNPGSDESMPWQLTMDAKKWESVTVPAGTFTALRYVNFADFRFSVFAERTAAQRSERVWIDPAVGRWVKRESWGTYHEQLHTEVNESSYRWELLSWT